MTAAVVLAGIALVVALAAMALAAVVMRQSGDALALIRAHRTAHADAYGSRDPKLDRRQVNLGAPRAVGERRGAHRYAPPDHLEPRDERRLLDDAPTGTIPVTGDDGAVRYLADVDPTAVRVVDATGATVWERGANPYEQLRRNADAPPTAEQPAVGRPRPRT